MASFPACRDGAIPETYAKSGIKVQMVGLDNSCARFDPGACRGLCRAANGVAYPLPCQNGIVDGKQPGMGGCEGRF